MPEIPNDDWRLQPASWELFKFNAESALAAPDDPERTVTVALTHTDVAIILAATEVYARLVPEIARLTLRLYMKVGEIGEAQGFFDLTDEQRETLGLQGIDPDDFERLGES